MEQYNRAAAVAYARTWAMRRNPKYLDFAKLGGDCTNFVSQCLFAGGMKQTRGLYGWYYENGYDKSASWTGVEFFYNYINKSGRGVFVERDELSVGDVIQLSFDGNFFAHTLIVSDISADEIFICAHDNDSLDRALSSYNFKRARYIKIK
ncbi:MAG: amidase domain-containing protein [Christensenellaceae bacterium]|jgi:hypothetical protein|nr:amidase domain-containing protein [Christensenellaceae bacterium]